MKFLCKSLVVILCLWPRWAVAQAPARAADMLPTRLRALAATATREATWPLLRRYAHSQKDSEWSGWAYFLAGYQEYEARRYSSAAEDLAQAAQSGFRLADYAVYYQASALGESGHLQESAEALQNFAMRFPQSHLRYKALALRAHDLLETEQVEQAIGALAAEPGIHHQPALALLLGQARMRTHQPLEAVAAFQDVYYGFPNSSQAKDAAEDLQILRTQLGSAYTPPDDAVQTARVEALARAGRYDEAQKEYGRLREDEPASSMAPRWQLGQAHCLLHLHRSADALQVLSTHFASPDLEAQRLALLVQVHAQEADATAVDQDVAQLAASYANSPAYADALSAAGILYYRQLNWQEAARNYQRLQELFPQSKHLREDGWRLAWCDYVLGDSQTSEVMRAYLVEFPDSPRAPAALYWLGRLQENQGSIGDARGLYTLLETRFVHTYYAPLAAARRRALSLKLRGAAAQADSSITFAVALERVLPPPVIPPGLACLATAPVDSSRPALILRALNLRNLEGDYARAALAGNHRSADLRLLLTEVYGEQKDTAAALYSAFRTVPDYAQMQFSDLPKEVWDYLYPRAYWNLIRRQARLRHLDPYLVMGLVRQESAFSPRAESISDARGLMQVLPETAAHSHRASRRRIVGRRLYGPTYNVRAGCAYLAGLMKEFDGRPDLAMAAYHAGDFRVKDWLQKLSFQDPEMFLESIPIPATRAYVELVLRDEGIYRQLLGASPRFARCPQAQPSALHRAAGTRRERRQPAGRGPTH